MAKDKYPLGALLNVRHYREKNAQRDVSLAKIAVKQAKELIIQAEEELKEYQVWLLAEEERLYAEILGHECYLDDIDEVKAKIAHLKLKEFQYEDNIVKAKQNLVLKEKELEDARLRYANAQKDTLKITTHQEIWIEEVNREEMLKEDLEAEEFKVKLINEYEE